MPFQSNEKTPRIQHSTNIITTYEHSTVNYKQEKPLRFLQALIKF